MIPLERGGLKPFFLVRRVGGWEWRIEVDLKPFLNPKSLIQNP
jgi:hypothetical protein